MGLTIRSPQNAITWEFCAHTQRPLRDKTFEPFKPDKEGIIDANSAFKLLESKNRPVFRNSAKIGSAYIFQFQGLRLAEVMEGATSPQSTKKYTVEKLHELPSVPLRDLAEMRYFERTRSGNCSRRKVLLMVLRVWADGFVSPLGSLGEAERTKGNY